MSESEHYQHWRCRDCAKNKFCIFGKRRGNDPLLDIKCWWYRKDKPDKHEQ